MHTRSGLEKVACTDALQVLSDQSLAQMHTRSSPNGVLGDTEARQVRSDTCDGSLLLRSEWTLGGKFLTHKHTPSAHAYEVRCEVRFGPARYNPWILSTMERDQPNAYTKQKHTNLLLVCQSEVSNSRGDAIDRNKCLVRTWSSNQPGPELLSCSIMKFNSAEDKSHY